VDAQAGVTQVLLIGCGVAVIAAAERWLA